MRAVPPAFTGKYVAHLKQRTVPEAVHPFYLKWLRYYLDFCEKYQFSHAQASSLPHFLRKLQEKKQSPVQQHQARHAIMLYYELFQSSEPEIPVRACSQAIAAGNRSDNSPTNRKAALEEPSRTIPVKTASHEVPVTPMCPDASPPATSVKHGASWKAEYDALANEIKVRHYSPKTLKTYKHWVREYQTFTCSQDPRDLTTEHVKRFLTSLAVRHKVAASTQNQAFNALLFFHRHVLKKEFGKVEGVVRAKRKPYIPVVRNVSSDLRHPFQEISGDRDACLIALTASASNCCPRTIMKKRRMPPPSEPPPTSHGWTHSRRFRRLGPSCCVAGCSWSPGKHLRC